MLFPNTADTIQIRRRETPQGTVPQRQEITQDFYILSAPLGWGHTKIVEGGRTLVDGEVRPGMLRVMSPGDSVMITGSVMKGAYAVVPGTLFRKLAAPPQQASVRGGHGKASSRFDNPRAHASRDCNLPRRSLPACEKTTQQRHRSERG